MLNIPLSHKKYSFIKILTGEKYRFCSSVYVFI